MKVLYCTHTPITLSETFLRKTLNYLSDKFDVEVISTAARGDTEYPCKSTFLSFRMNRLCNKVIALLNLLVFAKSKAHSEFDIERKFIYDFFQKSKISADAAIIEYGTSAYKFAHALNHFGIPYVICFHGYDASAYLGFKWYSEQLQTISNGAIMNVVPSNHLRRRLELIGVRRNLIEVEPCAPDYNSLPIRNTQKSLNITSLGRLTGKKLPQALILSAKLVVEKNPEVTFNIIGDGPLMDECKLLLEDLNLGKQVNLLGALDHQQALQLLSQANIFIQHSVTSAHGDQEGFPVSIAEASALGIPVVSTAHSGIPEGIIDGVTGFLVQEHDFEAMAEKILLLIESEDLRSRMGAAATHHIRRVAPNFQREKTIVKVIKRGGAATA